MEKCRQLEESREAARKGWRNAHAPSGFVEGVGALYLGMHPAQVRTQLGSPVATDSVTGQLIWTYAVADQDSLLVLFQDDSVVGWKRQEERNVGN